MGVQNPITTTMELYSRDGRYRSGYFPVLPTANTDYLFDSTYRPSASPYTMTAYWPNIDTKNIVQNFNHAYTGLEWSQPLWAYGGDTWVLYELFMAPAGMTIDGHLTPNVQGYYVPADTYANLFWQNPVAGEHRIIVRATDQTGHMVVFDWRLIVGTTYHHFMALNATGTGSGNSPSNYASYASTIIGQTTVSPCKGKVLHIKGDDYPSTAGINANTAYIAASMIAMPGQTPIFRQHINVTSDNIQLHGIKFATVGTSDFGVVGGYGIVHDFGMWRCTFEDCYKIGTGSNNNSCIGFAKSGSGYGRKRIFISECLFKNSTTLHGFDFYSINDYVFLRNRLEITNGTTVMSPSWIFPKLQSNGGEIMFNYADIPGVTTGNDSVIQLLNAWEPSWPISYNMTQRCEYNFVRTGGANVLRSNGDNDSVLESLPSNTLSNYIKRNTFIGGAVAGDFFNSTTARTIRHTYLESNVVINNVGGITVPANSSSWFFVSGTNVQGTPAAGLIDANGYINNPINHGKSGHGIWRPE